MKAKLVVLFMLFMLVNTNAQVIGKIFEKGYADNEFGNVLRFVEVKNNELINWLDNSGKHIMFNIDSGKIRAINDNRKSVEGFAKSDEEVFYRMSTSQVKLLIENGKKGVTKIEMRPKTMTLTNGEFTLERVDPCPDNCP